MVSQLPQLLLSVRRSAQVVLHIVPVGHVKPQVVPSHVAVAPVGGVHAKHAAPHAAVESFRSQMPSQRCWSAGHVQLPATQLSLRGHAVLQPPQCAASVCTSKQRSPHCVSAPQPKPQLVPSQVGVLPTGPRHGVHELVPQLVTALLLTHFPSHRCEPAGHSQLTFHSQLAPQLCVPVSPQTRVLSAGQVFSPLHADQAPYWPVPALHVRVWLPQLPHSWVAGPAHSCMPHALGH
jgi:hypothetical protein